MVGQDLLGDDVARDQSAEDRRADHRAARHVVDGQATVTPDRGQVGRHVLGSGLGEVARQQPDQLLHVADQRGVAIHLHAEVLVDGDRLRLGDQRGCGAHLGLVDVGDRAVLIHRHARQHVGDGIEPVGVLGDPFMVDQVGLHEDRGQRRDQVQVGARSDLQVDICQLGGLGAHRVDDDHRAPGILGDLLQDAACPREAMGLVGVLAQEQRHLAVLEVGAGRVPEHARVHPELAGLLLGQRAGAVPGTVGGHGRR